jgi:hypothetical protein
MRIAADGGNGLAFSFEPVSLPDGIETCRVVFEDKPVTITADEAMDYNPQERDGELDRAKRFIVDLLADGPVKASEAESAYQDAGIARRTIMRAKKELGIDSVKDENGWFWKHEIKSANGEKSALFTKVGTLGTVQQPRGLQPEKNPEIGQECQTIRIGTLEKITPQTTDRNGLLNGKNRQTKTADETSLIVFS